MSWVLVKSQQVEACLRWSLCVGWADDRHGPVFTTLPVEPHHQPHQRRNFSDSHLSQVCSCDVTQVIQVHVDSRWGWWCLSQWWCLVSMWTRIIQWQNNAARPLVTVFSFILSSSLSHRVTVIFSALNWYAPGDITSRNVICAWTQSSSRPYSSCQSSSHPVQLSLVTRPSLLIVQRQSRTTSSPVSTEVRDRSWLYRLRVSPAISTTQPPTRSGMEMGISQSAVMLYDWG